MAQMNVNLAFSADTGKAKAQIAELQSLLSKIAYTGSTANATNTLQKDLQEASTAAKELQFHLNNAFNVSTGKFDLSMLDKSLKTSGSNITDLSTKLLGAGATGQQAFATLAQSISLADQPMLRVSKRMQEFAVTMKNTVKWQLSSSMLHGFMGAIQSAYGYAQDLNKSLTDIRIVTGYSTDQMAQFAEQANKAAKALSTTTTDYTNASLIYFQQGLSDAEVAARTDITVKMANAAGQSAEVVSEQLTAVWNNFANGSKSLEYYADVMTALGAATASSSDEISEGLSKFSAVAESVGLSYEYATAALTTITSNTRESADVVGNALKTLFARLQGLKLGETLEDGVDLNKYSEALDKAGISIFEQNGELKAMDNILNDMAAKWGTMSNTQQVALAQTVAGVRQYNQLIALMENWDNGDEDSMMANLKTIENADGALQKQADIYAQSWEAAQKRVQAAAEGIYQSLLDDNFFISISNGFANLLGGLDAFIENAGGVKTVLVGIAGIVSSVFANQIPQALDNFKYNLEIVTKGTQAAYERMQNQMAEATQTAFNEYTTSGGNKGIKEDSATGYAIKQANELTVARNKLAMVSDKMSNSEKQLADMSLSIIQSRQEEVTALKQKNEAMQESIELQKKEILQASVGDKISQQSSKVLLDDTVEDLKGQKQFYDSSAQRSGKKQKAYQAEAESYGKALEEIKVFSDQFDARKEEIRVSYDDLHKIIFEGFQKVQNGDIIQPITSEQLFGELDFANPKNAIDSMIQSIERLGATATDKNKDTILEAMRDEVGALSSTIPDAIQKATDLKQIFDKIASKSSVQNLDQMDEAIKDLKDGLKAAKIEGKDFENILKGFHGNKISTLSQAMETLKNNESDATAKAEALQRLLNSFNPGHIVRLSEAFGGLVGFLGSTVAIGNSVKSMLMSLSDPDLSGWEKFSSVIIGITTILPSAKAAFEGLNTAIQGGNQWIATQNLLLGASSGAFGANTAAIGKKTMAEIASYIATQKATGALEEDIVATVTAKLMTKGLAQADAEAAAAAMVHAGGVEFLNGALTKLGALLTWIKGHMLLAIGIAAAVVAAIAGIAWIVDQVVVTQKEANEAIAEANNKYDEEKQKLDELESSLKSVQDQIKELQSQDSLSLVEQKELDKLLEQEASLQRQVALQEQLAQAAKQESADTFEENVSKASKWINDAPTIERSSYVENPTTGEYIYTDYLNPEQYKELVDSLYFDEKGNLLEGLNQSYEDHLAYYEAWKTEYAKEQAEWVNTNKDSFDEVTKGYQNWYDIYGNKEGYEQQVLEYANLISNMNKAIYGEQYDDKVLGSMDKTFQASKDTADQNIVNNIAKDLNDGTLELTAQDIANSFSNTFKNNLLKQGILPEDYAQHLLDDYERAASALADTGVTLEDLLGTEGFDVSDLDILANIKLTGEETLEEILAKIEAYKNNTIEVGFNLQDFKTNYSFAQGVKDGESYSADDITQLDVAYQQYFQEQLDGSYKLTIAASEFKEIVESIELDKLQKEIASQKEQLGAAGNITSEQLEQYSSGQETNKQLVEAMGGVWTEEDQEANIEATQAAAAAYMELSNSLIANSEAASLTADTVAELDALLANGSISIEQYNQRLEQMRNTVDADVDTEQYENLTKLIQSMAEASDDNREGAQEFSEDLKDNEKAAKKVAEAILRYDSAVEDVKKNSKDWMKILKSGNLQDMAEIMDDLQNSYEDMLDLDGDVLSDDFITNTENLELMTKAANGSEEAYNELAKRASEDIIAQCKLEADFNQAKFDTALADFQAQCAALNLPDLEVGANLDQGNFLQACTDLVNAAGMTADQATSYLASMGVDAEVVSEPETVDDPVTYVNAIPTVSWTGGLGTNPVTGLPQAYRFPSVGYDLSPETITTQKQTTGTALKVTAANKSSGGGVKHNNSSSGSGSNSKPSGGGGGGKSSKKPEQKSTSDRTRYHTLTNQLEDLTAEYDKISDAADRAFGKDKLKKIDDEIKATDNLIKKQEEYIAAISQNLPVDKGVMTEYYKSVIGGPAMEFDENGNISNYDDIEAAMHAKYNEMAQTYTEDSVEWQAFEKQYEQLEKYIEQYEETYDLLREQNAELDALKAQKIDLALEKTQYDIELQLNISDDSLAMIDYQLEQIEDDAFNAAESISLATNKANEIYKQMAINKQGLEDTLGLSLTSGQIGMLMSGDMSVLKDGIFTEDQIDTIKEYRDNLLELNQELMEIQKQIEEEVLNTFDEWHEKLDEGIEQFDHYGDILENYKNIVDIVGKDVLGVSNETMAKLSQTQIDNSLNQLRSMREAYESYQKSADEAAEKMKAAQDKATMHREAEEAARLAGDKEEAEKQAQLAESYEEDAAMWEEAYTEMNTAAQDAQQELMDGWTGTLESIVEQFELAVERAVEAFNDAIYGLGGLEGLSNEFERQQEMADMYLKDYEQIYELSKLSRDINNTIDDTKSLAGKQKLKALLEDINDIQAEGVEMSEYDLEYLQAEYDLRLAEIALEEAQRAKDTVRLSKDNEGNWSYVYTQNTDAVDEAQQKYEDALYSMQDLSSNYIDEMSAKLIETSQEMQEALANVRVEDFASQEEYYAELQRIEEQYREQMAKEEAELNKAIGNNKVLYDTDWANYSAATGYKISETDKFVTSFKDSMLGLLTESDTDTSNFTNIIGEATTALVAGLGEAATTYYSNIDAAMQAAGTSTGDFAELLAEDIEAIKTESAEAAAAVEDMATKMDTAMTAVTDRVDKFQQDYGRNIDLIIGKNEEMVRTFNEMLETLSVDPDKINVTYDISKSQDGEGGETVEVPEGTATGYTGMYTGEWGSEGKVAVLHEKELLLNQGDTENFLKALEFTKQMMSVIDFQIQQASMGLGALNAATVHDKYQEVLEQQVSIQAEFPNVQDHNEIEEAMRNLINTASQYANRKS